MVCQQYFYTLSQLIPLCLIAKILEYFVYYSHTYFIVLRVNNNKIRTCLWLVYYIEKNENY